MNRITHEAIFQAQDKLSTLSASEEERYRALVRERALFDETTELKLARQEGQAVVLLRQLK